MRQNSSLAKTRQGANWRNTSPVLSRAWLSEEIADGGNNLCWQRVANRAYAGYQFPLDGETFHKVRLDSSEDHSSSRLSSGDKGWGYRCASPKAGSLDHTWGSRANP